MKELHKAIQFARSVHDQSDGPADSTAVILGALIRAVEILAGKDVTIMSDTAPRNSNPVTEPFIENTLVDNLLETFAFAQANHGENGRAAQLAGIRAVLSELTKMPCELPSADEMVAACQQSHPIFTKINDVDGEAIERLVHDHVSPILAAKDARIEELEVKLGECQRLLVTRVEAARLDAANARIAELESRTPANSCTDAEHEQQKARIIELTAANDGYRRRALQGDAELSKLAKRIHDLEKLLAPVSADGKTPGQLFGNVFEATYKEYTKLGCSEFACIQIGREQGAKAVIRAFGNGAETLREALEGCETRLLASNE